MIRPIKKIASAYFQPLLFFLGKHGFFDHPRLDRNTCEAFKPKPNIAVEFAFSLNTDRRETLSWS